MRQNKILIAERQAEIKRVLDYFRQRRLQLQSLLETLSARELRHVRTINKQTKGGYLAELWDEFHHLDVKAMKQALDGEQFNGMAWQSLLQANPFIVARVGNWDKSAGK